MRKDLQHDIHMFLERKGLEVTPKQESLMVDHLVRYMEHHKEEAIPRAVDTVLG
jgi:hypothetical protein